MSVPRAITMDSEPCGCDNCMIDDAEHCEYLSSWGSSTRETPQYKRSVSLSSQQSPRNSSASYIPPTTPQRPRGYVSLVYQDQDRFNDTKLQSSSNGTLVKSRAQSYSSSNGGIIQSIEHDLTPRSQSHYQKMRRDDNVHDNDMKLATEKAKQERKTSKEGTDDLMRLNDNDSQNRNFSMAVFSVCISLLVVFSACISLLVMLIVWACGKFLR